MKQSTAFLNLLSIAATAAAATIDRDLAVFERAEEQYVYALLDDTKNFCGYDNHAAVRCNGKLASIGNSDELALIMMLLGRNSPSQAWIGGQYNSTSSSWGWSDGSTWFDDNEAMWQGGAVSTGPNIRLKTDGTDYWYQPVTNDWCGPSQKGAGIIILPADYDDPNAPFYETNDFALCQSEVIDGIIDSVSTAGNAWQIIFTGLDTDFTSSSDTELTMKYDIGKNGPFGSSDSGAYKTILYEKDCTTEIDTTGALFTLADSGRAEKTPEDPLFSSIELRYDVDKSSIGSSSVWNSTTNQIEICQVVQLIEESGALGEMIITKDTRVVTIEFDLSASFNVTSGLEEAALTSAAGDTTLEDYLLVYKCDEAFAADSSPLIENNELYICFESISADVEIDEVETMTITQGEVNIPVIVDSVIEYPVITEETIVSPTNQVVLTRAPSNLIDFASGNTIDVVGTVIMQLVGEGSGRRKLRADAKIDRTGFDVKVDLQSGAIEDDLALESSASLGMGIEGITTSLSLAITSACIMLWM